VETSTRLVNKRWRRRKCMQCVGGPPSPYPDVDILTAHAQFAVLVAHARRQRLPHASDHNGLWQSTITIRAGHGTRTPIPSPVQTVLLSRASTLPSSSYDRSESTLSFFLFPTSSGGSGVSVCLVNSDHCSSSIILPARHLRFGRKRGHSLFVFKRYDRT
jgi:hypothetical protein